MIGRQTGRPLLPRSAKSGNHHARRPDLGVLSGEACDGASALCTTDGKASPRGCEGCLPPIGLMQPNKLSVYHLVQEDRAVIVMLAAATGLTAACTSNTTVVQPVTAPRAHLTGRSSRFRRRNVRGCGDNSGGVAGSRLGDAVTRHRTHRRSPRSRRDRARRHQLILQFGPCV
jgi:hypothetical protein